MEVSFTVKVVLTIDHEPLDNKSTVAKVDFNLDRISQNLDPRPYMHKGIPTANGAKVITNAFVHGLIANIHASHQSGFRDSAEHLRYIIDTLEQGFIQQVKVSESKFDDEGGQRL